MTTRILLAARLKAAAVRRRRKSDGALFAVCKLEDRDRMESRTWTAFANDERVIEALEELRVGEPLAACGPFTAFPAANGEGVDWKISIDGLLATKRPKKSKTAKGREERIKSDEADGAPQARDDGEAFYDDPIGF